MAETMVTDWDLVNMLDDVSVSMETVLVHLGEFMAPADLKTRTELCRRARRICDRLLRSEKADED